jgi:hypothetical protein
MLQAAVTSPFGSGVGEAGLKPLPGPVAEAVGAAARQPPGAVERILLVAAAVQGVVLDAATDVVEGGQGELAYMERVEDPSRCG